jgi:hypothetical protein
MKGLEDTGFPSFYGILISPKTLCRSKSAQYYGSVRSALPLTAIAPWEALFDRLGIELEDAANQARTVLNGAIYHARRKIPVNYPISKSRQVSAKKYNWCSVSRGGAFFRRFML